VTLFAYRNPDIAVTARVTFSGELRPAPPRPVPARVRPTYTG
jgi:hypothetical protein